MYPSTELIPHLSSLPAYGSYQGTLVNVFCYVLWRCGHVHSFESTARDCAEYEKARRLKGR
jgi:hypothetical protein